MKSTAVLVLLLVAVVACGGPPEAEIEATVEARTQQTDASLDAPVTAPITPNPTHEASLSGVKQLPQTETSGHTLDSLTTKIYQFASNSLGDELQIRIERLDEPEVWLNVKDD